MPRCPIVCLFLTLLTVCLSGCGTALSPIEGTITLDGKPVKGLEVTFQPVGPEGGSALGYTDEQGHYTMQFPRGQVGAPPGEYVVRITGSEVEGGGAVTKVPAKYGSKSDLKRTVTSGENTFDFDLKSK